MNMGVRSVGGTFRSRKLEAPEEASSERRE
jgi:hypothetical protein